jgi:membrane-associated phospholipid phosphatase
MISHLSMGRNDRDDVGSASTTARWRAVCLLTLGAFLGLGLAAFATGILPGDLSVRAELATGDGSPLHTLARWVNLAGTWRVLGPASLLLFLLSRAARRHWWLWAGVLIGSGLIEHAVKLLVGRPRPSGFSLGFPSGHTTAAATFAVIVIYLATRERLGAGPRLTVQALAVLIMVLVGWARIVLHAHWPTDVLGGFLLGTGSAAAAAWWASGSERA